MVGGQFHLIAAPGTQAVDRFGAGLDDAVGERQLQNQPGTIDEYPNWRVPLAGPDEKPLWLEDVLASERVAELVRTVRD